MIRLLTSWTPADALAHAELALSKCQSQTTTKSSADELRNLCETLPFCDLN